jgi:hypothetical protein
MRLLTALCRLSQATGPSTAFTSHAISGASYAPMPPELYRGCQQAVHVRCADGRVLRAGRVWLYVLQALGYRRLATLLSSPVPLVSRGRAQINRQASVLVRMLAVYS